jgi:8-oxo-dGTP pyrophosphatase MutT (NUDIX family)
VVYVERDTELLVFDHRDDPAAGTQVPAGGLLDGEAPAAAAIREVREETGIKLLGEPTFVGTHEHLDGGGRPALSHFLRVDAPNDLPDAWEHVVMGSGEDRGLVFSCRFDAAPKLSPVQAVYWRLR